jgi:hypothetical protein
MLVRHENGSEHIVRIRWDENARRYVTGLVDDTVQTQMYRERLGDGSHGDVHWQAWLRGEQRSGFAVCDRMVYGMRKQSTPFRGWQDVACAECTRVMERMAT